MILTNSTTLKELSFEENITLRAFNTARSADLETVQDLAEFYKTHGSFKKIRGCGDKTDEELIELSKEYLKNASNNFVVKRLEKETEPPELDNPLVVEKVNYLIKINFKKLSNRAKKVLNDLFEKEFPDIQDIFSFFIKGKKKATQIRQVGIKTGIELDEFVTESVRLFLDSQAKDVFTFEIQLLQIKDATGIDLTNNTALYEDLKQNKFPVIKFITSYLKELCKFKPVEEEILKNSFNFYENKLTLAELGSKFNLTRERIRQLRNHVAKHYNKKFTFVNKLKETLVNSNYLILDKNLHYVEVDDQYMEQFCNYEKVSVSEKFFAFILYQFNKKEYYLLNEDEELDTVFNIHDRQFYYENRKIKGNYLIGNRFINKDSLVNILSKVLEIYCNKIEGDITISFKSFVKEELTNKDIEIASAILKAEFNLDCKGDLMHFYRNRPKLVYEYIYEALTNIKKPAHISEIYSYLEITFPEIEFSESSIRAAILHRKNLFIFFGRTSTYGLKEWEKEYENIKGGTIRDIVEEFLDDYNVPCHISSITTYVNRYRKTDDRSIITNLRMTNEGRFTFYFGGFVGLTTKDYEKLNKNKSYHFEKVSLDNLLEDIFSK